MAPELLYHHTSIRLLHRAKPLTLICGDHHRYALDALGCLVFINFCRKSLTPNLINIISQPVMPPYGVPYAALYAHGGVYAHPGVPIVSSCDWCLLLITYNSYNFFVIFFDCYILFVPYLSKVFTTSSM